MKNRLLKAGAVALVLGVIVGITGATTVQIRHDRTFDVPEVAITASTDSAVIARGAYLVYGPAHCAYCHTTQDKWARLDAGEQVPLSGGYVFDIGIAKMTTPNLTPDAETGIGNVSDGKIARMLRHNVRRDGTAAIPFMEFQSLSDEDLLAVVSYLRSQPAVSNAVAPRELRPIGKAIMSFAIGPFPPSSPPAQSPPEGATVERGEYLVTAVAACAGCHTERSMKDGSYLAPKLSGGTPMLGEDGLNYTAPNLTPDPATGHIAKWSEEQFLTRFRAGSINGAGSHMPWKAFARMSDDDIRAIYRYLQTVPASANTPGPLVSKPEQT